MGALVKSRVHFSCRCTAKPQSLWPSSSRKTALEDSRQLHDNRRNARVIVALFAALLMSATGWGQQTPDLSGTWKLNLAQSDYGDLQGPNSRTDMIEQRDGKITETVVAVQRHKQQSYVLHFSTDGRKTVLPAGAEIHIPPVTVQSISASWQGKTLVVMEELKYDDANLPARTLYVLSADRNELTMKLFLGGEGLAATFVFDRAGQRR